MLLITTDKRMPRRQRGKTKRADRSNSDRCIAINYVRNNGGKCHALLAKELRELHPDRYNRKNVLNGNTLKTWKNEYILAEANKMGLAKGFRLRKKNVRN